MHFLNFIALLSVCIWSTGAIPTWDMFTSRSRVGDLVPGTSIIHAYGPTSVRAPKAKFLRSNDLPGLESNITVGEWVYGELGPPSKFFVSNGGLYQITNHTTILYTNLLNATDHMAHRTSSELNGDLGGRSIFRMSLSTKKDGLIGGSWDWVATTLQYKLGSKSNNGLFYKCTETNGDTSVYVPLDM
ncbi:hypothetical protein Clacol_001358 [Clathrus columnatus]|uniref:Uncharacterized protein n=1 Tax=Clathrus columnatus TaxID=1419009 RepID=A0AAV5A102_9AGAM|nr:hypothetical protein Clacol_001358 [Clathrus columnatus]